MLAVGGIYYLWCAAMYPPKEKFFICVDAERRWFLIINSRPVAKVAPETQLEVTNVEIGVLPKPESFVDGKVHAKIAVVDGTRAFITSANLTSYALEKNIEAGVLINGGPVPKTLSDHLQALIDVRIIVRA